MHLRNIVLANSLASAALLVALGGASAQIAESCFSDTETTSCIPMVDISSGRSESSSYDQLSRAYAELAWQDFLSLSLPDPSNLPHSAGPQTPGPTPHLGYYATARENHVSYVPKWLNFISATDLFPADGRLRPYAAEPSVPAKCKENKDAGMVLSSIAKGGILDEYSQANRMGPVIDQNKNYLRFGIGFNEVMYTFVSQNKLYTADGQKDFDKKTGADTEVPINWPSGDKNEYGSIFVKSAWKILTNADDSNQYFTTKAYIYTPQTYDPKADPSDPKAGPFNGETRIGEPECIVKEVALIGLHIVHRTPSAPQWVWATFEHKQNAPWIDEFKSGTPKGPFSLFDPAACISRKDGLPSCLYNQVPAHPWNPTSSNPKSPIPSQVIRMFRPGKMAAELNSQVSQKLEKIPGPWKNYFLVDVQFPTVLARSDDGTWSENPAYPDGLPSPSFLANSTMETYIQGFSGGLLNSDGAKVRTSTGSEVPSEDRMQRAGSAASMHGISGGVQRVTSSCVSCHYDATTTTGTNSNFVFSLSRAR